ncbi:hypothetical protein [Alloprevotella tannerae]|uniref:hypothetical protein n=1 Tax=Alloprevotella tannerae TaxID=76122 RepID=UPI0028EC79D3|nr:hypothetical protein [Alloprevotella tannerae]
MNRFMTNDFRLLPANNGLLPPNDSLLPPNDGLLPPNNTLMRFAQLQWQDRQPALCAWQSFLPAPRRKIDFPKIYARFLGL